MPSFSFHPWHLLHLRGNRPCQPVSLRAKQRAQRPFNSMESSLFLSAHTGPQLRGVFCPIFFHVSRLSSFLTAHAGLQLRGVFSPIFFRVARLSSFLSAHTGPQLRGVFLSFFLSCCSFVVVFDRAYGTSVARRFSLLFSFIVSFLVDCPWCLLTLFVSSR